MLTTALIVEPAYREGARERYPGSRSLVHVVGQKPLCDRELEEVLSRDARGEHLP